MAKPIVAIMYDFDKTLSTTDMQNYSFIPNLGMSPEDFWGETGKFTETQGVESYRKEIFRSFGVNEKFLDSSFTENDWQAIHEGVFEALQLALQQELTNKIFTSREFEYGNRIITEVNKLQTASLSTRIKIAEIYEKLPVIRPNTVCELLYLPSLEDGDKEVQSLNFVESGKANTYQGVDDDNDDKPKNDKKEGEEDA